MSKHSVPIICKIGYHPWKRDGRFRSGKRRYVCRRGCGAVGAFNGI